MYFKLIIFFLYAKYSYSSARDVPRVKLDDGVIVGTTYRTVYGREIFGFFGVPFAAPPIGENRFEPPKSVQKWPGEWNATIEASPCIQYAHINYSVVGEEDCLYLNIYTPQLPNKNDKLLDVIVYIHGGAFQFGSGIYKKPDHLLKHNNIVFVTVAYRVGPLGFLSTGDNVIPGNNGLKDQSFALQWIQKNIAKFGGNPSQVTISGMSAGGASVHYHFLSPMSKGLFQRGVSQSGCALVSWALPKSVTEKTRRLASLLGCPTCCSKKLLDCLKSRPARQIVQNVKEFMPWLYNPYSPFGPVVEPSGSGSFISEKPIDIIRKGKVQNIPWLISVTEDEGLYPVGEFIHQEQIMKELNDQWNDIAPHLLDYNFTVAPEIRDTISQQIRQHLFKNEEISSSNYKTLTKVVGDRLFIAYIEFAIREQVKANPAPIYYYKFNYRGKYSLSEFYSHTNNDYGVSHGDDTQYILKVIYGHPQDNPQGEKMVDVMVPLWLSFAHTGKPQVKSIHWPSVSKNADKDGITYLEINSPSDIKLERTKDTRILEFWNFLLNEFKIEDGSVHEEL